MQVAIADIQFAVQMQANYALSPDQKVTTAKAYRLESAEPLDQMGGTAIGQL